MFGNMAGTPVASSGAAGGSMVPTPPPPVASSPTSSMSPLAVIMKAIQDPATMAQKMADFGITPDMFKQAMESHNLAGTMNPNGGQPANADTAFGSDKAESANYKPLSTTPIEDKAGSIWQDAFPFHPGNAIDTETMMAPKDSGTPASEGNKQFITLDDIIRYFKSGVDSNQASKATVGNPRERWAQAVQGESKLPIMPPVTGPAAVDGIPSLKVGDSAPTIPPVIPYTGTTPNHMLPPMVGEQYSARAGQMETRGMPADMREYISNAAVAAGLDPNYMLRQAIIESGGNPKAYNEGSKASGLYQFIPSTAKQYGLADPFDWKASTNAAVKLAQDNKAYLEKALGREPSNAELYLAHQQGAKGAADMLMNRDMPATGFVGAKAITANGGDPSMSAGQYVDMWEKRYNEPSMGGSSGGTSGGDNSGATVSGGSGNDSLGTGSDVGTSAGNTATPKSLQSRLADMAAALQQGGGGNGESWMSAKNMNLPQAPAPVAPRPGQYQADPNMAKLLLGLLYGAGAGGPQIPSLGQLM